MEIKYLKILEENPVYKKSDGSLNALKPISIDEIKELEKKYNNGNSFPAVLKELLYLAGNDCYSIDYVNTDSQDDMQQTAREYLQETHEEINRLYYVIEFRAGAFLFVYLDEEKPDPDLYNANPWKSSTEELIRPISCTLSELVKHRTNRLLRGYNPF